MSGWAQAACLIGAVLMIWFLVRTIRGNPQAFSKENLGKSVYTFGILALLLIVVIFICVMLLKAS